MEVKSLVWKDSEIQIISQKKIRNVFAARVIMRDVDQFTVFASNLTIKLWNYYDGLDAFIDPGKLKYTRVMNLTLVPLFTLIIINVQKFFTFNFSPSNQIIYRFHIFFADKSSIKICKLLCFMISNDTCNW